MAEARTLRLCLTSTETGWGGGEEQLRLLGVALRHRGHDVTALVPAGSPLEQRLDPAEFDVRVFSRTARRFQGVSTLWRLARKKRLDVLHANDGASARMHAVVALGLRPRPLRVSAFRTALPFAAGIGQRTADAVIAVSHAAAEQAARAGIPPDRTHVVHDGFSWTMPGQSAVSAADRAWGGGPGPRLLAIGNLYRVKGHDDLLRALSSVVQEAPEARLVIAGDGPERTRLAALIDELGLGSYVSLPGFRDDTDALIAAADLLIHPSREGEGLGSVVIQAMMAGLPVVTTDAGGLGELSGRSTSDGWEAWHRPVPHSTPNLLARAILEALRDPASATADPSVVCQLFSVDRMVELTLDAIRSALR